MISNPSQRGCVGRSQTTRASRTVAGALVTALLAACSTPTPPQATPSVPLSERFSRAAGADASLSGQWWSSFGDDVLTQLVLQALDNNQDVQIALQRVKAAQSGVKVQSSLLLPSVDAQLNTERVSSGLPAAVKASGQPDILGSQAGLRLSWEVDLSGALRAARDAAKSDLIAAQAGVVGARLEVASEVARQYFVYRSAERRLALLEQLVDSQRQTAGVVAERVQQGESSRYELDLAQSDVDALEAQVPALRSLCASTQAGMATLLGVNPSQLPIRATAAYEWPRAMPIGSGQPTDLLRRRPDLLAAEARYSAESLRAAQARDQLWPRLFLSALVGNEGLKLNALDLSPVHYENVAAAFAMPLFNSGRITAIADGQDAVAAQMLLQWQHDVLVAVQEVESSLTVKTNEDLRSASLGHELMRRQSAVSHARSLFREGQIGKLTLLQVQRAELAGELDTADGDERRMLSYVQLYKALGGGWTADAGSSAAKTTISVIATDPRKTR